MALLDDIDDGRLSTSSELLRTVVPGYDYRSQEQLKRTDEKLREKFRRDFTQALQRLDDVHDRLYDAGRRGAADRLATLRDDFETMRRRVETAESGGGALRSVVTEDESDLVALVEYDATLVEASEALVDRVAEMADPADEGDIDDRLAECERAISEFERAFQERQSQLSGLR